MANSSTCWTPGERSILPPRVLAEAAQAFDHLPHPFRFQAQFAQDTPGNAAFLLDQAQEQMFGADISLTHRSASWCARLRHPPRPLGKTFHSSHGNSSFSIPLPR